MGPACQEVDVLCEILNAGATCARIDLTVRYSLHHLPTRSTAYDVGLHDVGLSCWPFQSVGLPERVLHTMWACTMWACTMPVLLALSERGLCRTSHWRFIRPAPLQHVLKGSSSPVP